MRAGTIPGHDGRGRLHLALSISAQDLDLWRKRLADRGVDIVGEYRWPRGGTSLYIRDPDGALVELATPACGGERNLGRTARAASAELLLDRRAFWHDSPRGK